MELDKAEEILEDDLMDFDETNNNKDDDDDDDDEESILCQNLPTQTNQNSSSRSAVPISKAYGSGQLHQNYMYQTLLFNQSINLNKKICSEIIHLRKTEEMIQQACSTEFMRIVSQTSYVVTDKFNYTMESIIDFKEQVEMETNCEWLDCRLEVLKILNDESMSLDQLICQLRASLINVSNDLMIYYHTKSDFAQQLIRMESFNLLALLKEPKLAIVTNNLQDGFSQFLLSIVKDGKVIENNGEALKISIPSLSENIMNNYVIMDPRRPSLKIRFHNTPKVVFYSFYAPAYIVMPANHINSILDKKIISMQRKYFCKVILDGPFSRSTSSNTKHEYYRFDIFFDYQYNYWFVVKSELIKWMDGFVRAMFQCYIDKVCLSYVTQDFFCCDEIQNLMKRQHLLREIDPTFVKLIKWAKVNQVDRAIL